MDKKLLVFAIVMMACAIIVFIIGKTFKEAPKVRQLPNQFNAHVIHTKIGAKEELRSLSISCVDSRASGCVACWIEGHSIICTELHIGD